MDRITYCFVEIDVKLNFNFIRTFVIEIQREKQIAFNWNFSFYDFRALSLIDNSNIFKKIMNYK